MKKRDFLKLVFNTASLSIFSALPSFSNSHKKKMDEARVQYGDSEGCYVYPRTLEDKLDERLSLKGWDKWGYDIKVVDGSIVVKHKNRPTSKHPQYNSKN